LQPDNGISCLDLFYALQHSFKTRFGRSIQDPADPELQLSWLKKKQGKKKLSMTRLTWRPGKTRSKTWLQPVDFFFFY
jgi:hypothetical protein